MRHPILFLGTPEFAIPALEKLHEEHDILAVVTQPDRPAGRKKIPTAPPIKTKAQELGLKVLQPEKASQIPALFKEKVAFLVTAAYGEYLPGKVLDIPEKDSLNIHPSLIPKYRGATPIQSALLNGDKETGVTIMRMVKEMDAGPVFKQEKFLLNPDIQHLELEEKCAKIGAKLLSEVLANYGSMKPKNQDESQVSFCQKIIKADGQTDWTDDSAGRLYNKLRAFSPWPGVFTFWKGQRLSLIDFASLLHQNPKMGLGKVFEEEGQILIRCSGGSISLKTVQLAGKKEADIKSFINGHPDFIGSTLG